MAHNFAPVQLSEREGQSQQETFRGPEFQEELESSRRLSADPLQGILDAIQPLETLREGDLQRSSRNLRDQFRLTGGRKSSSFGRRAGELAGQFQTRNAAARSSDIARFLGPLLQAQQGRLSVAGQPLSRGSGSSRSSTFGFDEAALQRERLDAEREFETGRNFTSASIATAGNQTDANIAGARIRAGSRTPPSPTRAGVVTGPRRLTLNRDIENLINENPGGLFDRGSGSVGPTNFAPQTPSNQIFFNPGTNQASTNPISGGFNSFPQSGVDTDFGGFDDFEFDF